MENIYQKAFQNARLHQNLSLGRFATLFSVNKQYIWRIEKGLQKPSIALIKKLESITNLSFYALVAGDFDNQNQKNYVKISNINPNHMINFNEFSLKDREYLLNKFNADISEIEEQVAEAKSRLAKRLEKSTLSESELSAFEAEVQKAKAALTFMTNANALAEMIANQQTLVDKAESDLAEKKRKGGIISDREAALEELNIEESEMKIKLREDKIAAIKAVV